MKLNERTGFGPYLKESISMSKTIIAILMLFASIAYAQDTRYCGPPQRDAEGKIKRSTKIINAFKKVHPCPSNGMIHGPCPGWSIDHVIPLACGGCDAIINMQWLPREYKTTGKDRWERKIYDLGLPGTDNCKNEIVIP